jgi:hypothetical protein
LVLRALKYQKISVGTVDLPENHKDFCQGLQQQSTNHKKSENQWDFQPGAERKQHKNITKDYSNS